MKIAANLARIITGFVFVFSGFVKGVDPLGFAYKLEDYFIAWNTGWLISFALFFSILLCTVEFSLGVFLLLKFKIKLTAWLVLLMMVFFTVLTFFDALYNPVPDCGCFGDAIKLTNWQTFYKNIVLILLAIAVFGYRNKYRPFISQKMQWISGIGVMLLFAGFSTWCYRNLPPIDFTEWKVGHKLYVENPRPLKYFLIYKNKETNEQKEFLSPNYPYDDSVWMSKWEFVAQRTEDPNEYYGKTLLISDTLGENHTNAIIRNQGYQLIITVYNIDKANQTGINALLDFCSRVASDSVHTAILVNAMPKEIAKFILDYKLEIAVYQADDIILKTMVRSNPGLMLLHKGIITAKWHFRNIPDSDEFKKKYIK